MKHMMSALTLEFWRSDSRGWYFVCPYCRTDDHDHSLDCPWTIEDPRLSEADRRLISKQYNERINSEWYL